MTKNELKYYSSLLKKKYRDEEKKFIAEGSKVILEGLKITAWRQRCDKVFFTNSFIEEHNNLVKEINNFGIKSEIISAPELSKLSDTVTPQGIVAVFSKPDPVSLTSFRSNSGLSVILENISDPGNVGTIIRNCDWFGIKDIILSQDCADVYNPKTIRSCMGSLFHVNIYERANLPDFLNNLRNSEVSILCADLNGTNVFNYKVNKPSVLIFSNEANGPSEKILSLSDEIITIKKIGSAESLNVASASAVILAELTRDSLNQDYTE